MPNFALITGASGGIGEAIAEELAARGIPLLITARSEAKLDHLAQRLTRQYQVEVRAYTCDLSQPAAATHLAAWVSQQQVPLGYLVNNAGVGLFGLFAQADLARTLAMLQLNITSLVELTHRLLPQLRQSQGYVLNVASTAAFQPGPYLAAYYASKAFVLNFSEALTEELKPQGVSVTTLCPGPTATGFASAAGAGAGELFKRVGTAPVTPVAQLGVNAMLARRRVVVHGTKNWWLTQLVVLLPRAWVTKAIAAISRTRDLKR